ncbi:MAG: hypothetical protein ACKJSG_17785, partial [Lentisphaeria bacterium]
MSNYCLIFTAYALSRPTAHVGFRCGGLSALHCGASPISTVETVALSTVCQETFGISTTAGHHMQRITRDQAGKFAFNHQDEPLL